MTRRAPLDSLPMRLALVTGGSRGLGRALCDQLQASGYQVVEWSRTAPHPFSVRLDLSAPGAARAAAAASLADITTAGCEDIVVLNNAGTLAPIGPASRKPPGDVLENLNVNFTSAILLLSEVVSRFQNVACRKVIANISSGAALKGYAGWSLYCAAKAGMEGYIRALAVEQREEQHPFTAINIDPGVIDTDMQGLIRTAGKHDFPEVERFIRRKNEGGLASPARVASAVLNVLSRADLTAGMRYEVTEGG